MDAAAIVERVRGKFGDAVLGQGGPGLRTAGQAEGAETDGCRDAWFSVKREALPEIALFLRDEPDLGFDLLSCLSSVDWRTWAPKPKPKDPLPEERFEVVYHLESTALGHGIVLKVPLPLDDPRLPSLEKVWATADWHEREAWDLMGIRFEGHHNLVRILCAEDWEGHALRKDYQLPEQYHGVSCRFGDRLSLDHDPRWA